MGQIPVLREQMARMWLDFIFCDYIDTKYSL